MINDRIVMNTNASWFGIIGGMGTSAGLMFEQMFFDICKQSGIRGDQEYPQWIYLNASQVPDRTAAIKGEGPSCTPYLVEIIRKAEAVGVSAVVVTCNTAHYFYEEVFQQVPIPWIHLQRETARYIAKSYQCPEVGILATEGAIRGRLYHQAFEVVGLKALEPGPESDIQIDVMKAIYSPELGIKYTGNKVSDEAKRLLTGAVARLGGEVAVAGCTELSLAFRQMEIPITWIDPLEVAAQTLYEIWAGTKDITTL